MDGIYAMYFTGSVGSGSGLLLLKDGIVAGADSAGGIYDGSYTLEKTGAVNIKVRLTLPPGASLVTGVAAGANSLAMDIPAQLPENFGNGQAIALNTPTGPINIIFKKIRGLGACPSNA
jgi:hypothetical protein